MRCNVVHLHEGTTASAKQFFSTMWTKEDLRCLGAKTGNPKYQAHWESVRVACSRTWVNKEAAETTRRPRHLMKLWRCTCGRKKTVSATCCLDARSEVS